MTITLTTNYREILQSDTVAGIDRLLEDSFDLQAMLTFIDENSEQAFQECYEEYVELGELYSYEAVDAFIKLAGYQFLRNFEDAYLGCFTSVGEMAEEYFDKEMVDVDSRLCVDWHETGRNLLWDKEVEHVGNEYFFPSY